MVPSQKHACLKTYDFQIYDNVNIGGIPIMEIGIVFNKSQNLWRLGSL